MKNRYGFVANSSSSSYILHQSEIGKDAFDKLVAFLENFVEMQKIVNNDYYDDYYSRSWGDSGMNFEIHNGKYLEIELFHAPNEVISQFRRYVPNAEEKCVVIES